MIFRTLKIACLALLGVILANATLAANLKGLWTFDAASPLSAKVGTALTTGYTSGHTATWSTATGIGTGDGAYLKQRYAYLNVPHGIAANGGGTKVNRYTILWDVSYPSGSKGQWMSFYQADLANTTDAELF